MSQFTHDTPRPPARGATRTCTASTACPTVVLGLDEHRAERLMAEHESRVHGIPQPKAVRNATR